MINSHYKKITQALRYLISHNEHDRLNVLLLMKLVWATDRYHARKYGSLVTSYDYRALPNGPVSSIAYDIANASDFLSSEQVAYSGQFVARSEHDVVGIDPVETDYLSETDKEALDFAWQKFGDMNQFDVRDITHDYPEWKKFETLFHSGASSEKIDVRDFFSNPDNDQYFGEDDELLELSKAKLEENLNIRKLIRG